MGFNLCCFCVTGPVNTLDPAAQIVAYESTKKLQEDFAEGRKLGEGMFGKVILMTRKSDNKTFATKVMKKHMSISDNNEVFPAPAPSSLLREVKIMRKLGGKKQCLRLEVAIETPRDFYVLTDVCAGGELMKHLERCDQFVEQDASRFFAHFCGGVAHCHANRISHRANRCGHHIPAPHSITLGINTGDIKPENLLVTFERGGRARVVLADFGSAVEYKNDTRWRSEVGSPFWQSPEAWALVRSRVPCYAIDAIAATASSRAGLGLPGRRLLLRGGLVGAHARHAHGRRNPLVARRRLERAPALPEDVR